jgi:hypothetical protein
VSRARYPSITHPCAGRVSPYCYGSFSPRDLHVLATPPAFVLSQDQTLQSLIRVLHPEGRRGITFWLKHSQSRRLQECLRPHLCDPSRPGEATACDTGRATFPHPSNCSLFKDRGTVPKLDGRRSNDATVKSRSQENFQILFRPDLAATHKPPTFVAAGPEEFSCLLLAKDSAGSSASPWPWFASAPPFTSHSGNLPGSEVSSNRDLQPSTGKTIVYPRAGHCQDRTGFFFAIPRNPPDQRETITAATLHIVGLRPAGHYG